MEQRHAEIQNLGGLDLLFPTAGVLFLTRVLSWLPACIARSLPEGPQIAHKQCRFCLLSYRSAFAAGVDAVTLLGKFTFAIYVPRGTKCCIPYMSILSCVKNIVYTLNYKLHSVKKWPRGA